VQIECRSEPNCEAFSAGTIVNEINQRVRDRERAKNAIEVMRSDGLDIADNPRTQMTSTLADDYDHIVVMAEADTIPGFLKNDKKIEIWDIEDPAHMSLADTKKIADQIHNHVIDLGIRLHR